MSVRIKVVRDREEQIGRPVAWREIVEGDRYFVER
jgi:hypothetical protein